MKICGVDITGQEVILSVLECDAENCKTVDTGVYKMTLDESTSQQNVQQFSNTIYSFFKENSIEHIAIKQRLTKGKFAGGANTFKIEGIIQLYPDATTTIHASNLIANNQRKNPTDLTPKYKYQEDALHTAHAFYCKNIKK